jgi:ubiquinone/menaquinone biosynthesis C-methylase UbiE
MTQTPPQAPQKSWLIDKPLTGFALPSGRFARVYGWMLIRNTKTEQADVFRALDLRPGERVLEVGHGPGPLLAKIAEAGAGQVCGADPSETMVRMARQRLAKVTENADIRQGTAEDTGFDDASFDLAISVNNVPMWSGLQAGFGELHRVLKPGGRLVVAWHGGRNPTQIARRLTLPSEVLARILDELRATFGNGEHEQSERMEIFRAVR